MINRQEIEEFGKRIEKMSCEELKRELANLIEKNKKIENEFNLARDKYYHEHLNNEIREVEIEIKNKEQAEGKEILEACKESIFIEMLYERNNYPFTESSLKEWLLSRPGVKEVKIDGDGEMIDIYENDWEYFEKK